MVATPGRAGVWLALAASAAILAFVGAAGGSFVARHQADPRPSPSAATSPSASPSPSPAIVVRLPATLLGRAKTTDHTLVKAAQKAVAAQQNATSGAETVQAAYYGTSARRNLMFVLAVKAQSADPSVTYERVVAGMQAQQKGLKLIEISPGTLGGRAACGEAPVSGSPVTFCLWADNVSYAFVEFFGAHAAPQRAPFLRARTQIETIP
jgi:hypothetical protein